MSPGNRVQLLALANCEFRQLTNAKPVPEPNRKFKPTKLNPARFDQSWDIKRGAAVRLTSVLLRHDDVSLEGRVCENAKATKTYADVAESGSRVNPYAKD